ncbi:hypothetical protein GPALN_011395 [Globodera pallida]|nr:hypothetical protein GPALN_011395 [Globodera pallida]
MHSRHILCKFVTFYAKFVAFFIFIYGIFSILHLLTIFGAQFLLIYRKLPLPGESMKLTPKGLICIMCQIEAFGAKKSMRQLNGIFHFICPFIIVDYREV